MQKYSNETNVFRIHSTDDTYYPKNVWVIYSGTMPEQLDITNLIPDGEKEAREFADIHQLICGTEDFRINIFNCFDGPYPLKDQLILGTDSKGIVRDFGIPEQSLFKAVSLSEYCKGERLDYDALKQRCSKEFWEAIV